MRRLAILLLTLAIGVLFYGITQTSASAVEEPVLKSYVCKYKTTPGEGEQLQTGDNPIWVSNASLGVQGETFVGQEFNDAQGRSLVIIANTERLDPEPDVSICPPPDGEEPTPVQFSGLAAPTPPTCLEPGSFTLPDVLGVDFAVDPAAPPFVPGETYTITVTLEDPIGTTFPDGTTDPKVFTITIGEQLSGAVCEPSEGPTTGPPVTEPPVTEPPVTNAPPRPPPGGPGNPGVNNPGNPALFAPPAAAPPAAAPPAVPTTVDAGLASTEDTGNNWGLGLIVIGMLLLGAAWTVGRPRGQHQR